MLQYLSVKNFAILENIEVTFQNGFTALTGETGAGKSLLIDAIGLLLGDRANTDIVRTGEDYCEVKGLFVNLSDQVMQVLESLEISAPDKECLIIRQISKTSANTVKVNRQTITLQDLRLITEHLADIHTQHDTKRLINPETYLSLVDQFDLDTIELKKAYTFDLNHYMKALKAYNKLVNDKDNTLKELEFLRFQAEELARHQLKKGEEEAIESRLESLENFDTIYQNILKSLALFEQYELTETLYMIRSNFESISAYDPLYQTLKERMDTVYYELDDIKSTILDHSESLDFDPSELETLQSREHTLDLLKRKYKKSIDELIDYQEELNTSLETFEHYDDAIITHKKALNEAFNTLKNSANALSQKRQSIAREIEGKMLELLNDLELKQAAFEIRFTVSDMKDLTQASVFKKDGIDTVDFYLSTNKGEALKPLSKVASGGELSRIMLALKEILIKNMGLSLMIFDEIDTGVSGFVANQVALKMQSIAQSVQVITITHLPQVAAKSDAHYYIYKEERDQKTYAMIKVLNHTERIETIASMISSDKVTPHALKSAESLLNK
jgi:DNA repair protein RecN (Recombination protein N)